jgi:hypothetical protein
VAVLRPFGRGNSAILPTQVLQYTLATPVRSQSAPHASHTFNSTRRSFIYCFSKGIVLPRRASRKLRGRKGLAQAAIKCAGYRPRNLFSGSGGRSGTALSFVRHVSWKHSLSHGDGHSHRKAFRGRSFHLSHRLAGVPLLGESLLVITSRVTRVKRSFSRDVNHP